MNRFVVLQKYNTSFAALVALLAVVLSTIVLLLIKLSPVFITQAVSYCQQAATTLISQMLPTLSAVILLFIALLVLAGIMSFIVQLSKTQRFINRLLQHHQAVPKKLDTIATTLGLAQIVCVASDTNLYSFCYGLFRPRIIISSALIKTLTKQELAAVLLHEQAHAQNFDPLKTLVGKTISTVFFFLPIFRELLNHAEAAHEVLADQNVIQQQGNATFLKTALKKILLASLPLPVTAVGMAKADYLEIRLLRLTYPTKHYRLSVSKASLVTTVGFLVGAWFMLYVPAAAFQKESAQELSHGTCQAPAACVTQCRGNDDMSPRLAPQTEPMSNTPYALP